MKKLFALLLALCMVFALAACGGSKEPAPAPATEEPTPATEAPVEEPAGEPEQPAGEPEEPEAPEVSVMSHEEYVAAELDSEVVIETYVQAHQSWWQDQITVYGQSPDGAYFMYNMACSQEDADKLVPGTKIRVTGYKSEWSGEVEIVDATFEILEGDTFVAEPVDVTELLGTDELVAHQNELVSFKGLTVEAIEYKNGEPGDDIYVTLNYNGVSFDFCVEAYLTGPETEVYSAVGALNASDVVDLEGFLYWYEGPNTHIIAVTPAA